MRGQPRIPWFNIIPTKVAMWSTNHILHVQTPAWSKSSLSAGFPSESPTLRRREGRLFQEGSKTGTRQAWANKTTYWFCVNKNNVKLKNDEARSQQIKIVVAIWKGRVVLMVRMFLIGFVCLSKRVFTWHMCKPQAC